VAWHWSPPECCAVAARVQLPALLVQLAVQVPQGPLPLQRLYLVIL
jgi:hypothetical protein